LKSRALLIPQSMLVSVLPRVPLPLLVIFSPADRGALSVRSASTSRRQSLRRISFLSLAMAAPSEGGRQLTPPGGASRHIGSAVLVQFIDPSVSFLKGQCDVESKSCWRTVFYGYCRRRTRGDAPSIGSPPKIFPRADHWRTGLRQGRHDRHLSHNAHSLTQEAPKSHL
jgi:hypothetical protein